jgi:hypothetical protein
MSKATVGGPGAAEINPELPPENAAQIRILYRELWKRTMKSVPDYGGMWKQYRLIGSEYEAVGFPEDALQSGYLPALELCNSGVLVGKDGLRKKAKILINVADAYLAYVVHFCVLY